jgi:hypothetical protein
MKNDHRLKKNPNFVMKKTHRVIKNTFSDSLDTIEGVLIRKKSKNEEKKFA